MSKEVKESFVFYRSFHEAAKTLSHSERAILYAAIIEYALEQTEIELPNSCKGMFFLIKPQLDANQRKYQNGTKGGRPKKPDDNLEETKEEPNNNQTETKPKPNDNDNVNDNGNVNEEYKRAYENILGFKILTLNDKRKRKLKSFSEKIPISTFEQGLLKAKQSTFLMSGAFFKWDWIINEANFIKIMEGNYENNDSNNQRHGRAIPAKRSLSDQLAEQIAEFVEEVTSADNARKDASITSNSSADGRGY